MHVAPVAQPHSSLAQSSLVRSPTFMAQSSGLPPSVSRQPSLNGVYPAQMNGPRGRPFPSSYGAGSSRGMVMSQGVGAGMHRGVNGVGGVNGMNGVGGMKGVGSVNGINSINGSMTTSMNGSMKTMISPINTPINSSINHSITPIKPSMNPSMNQSMNQSMNPSINPSIHSPMLHTMATPINHSVSTPMKPTMNHMTSPMMNQGIIRTSPYYGPRPLSNMPPRPRQPLYTERRSVGRQEDLMTTNTAEVNRTNRIALPPINSSFSLQKAPSFTGSVNSHDMPRGTSVLRTESVANANSYFTTTKIAQV